MRQRRWTRALACGWNAVDGLVETDVRIFPVENADQVRTESAAELGHRGSPSCADRRTALRGATATGPHESVRRRVSDDHGKHFRTSGLHAQLPGLAVISWIGGVASSCC